MKTKLKLCRLIAFALILTPPTIVSAQKGGSAADSSSSSGGGADTGNSNSQSGQSNKGQTGASKGGTTATANAGRIEPAMLSYAASDEIARNIAAQVGGGTKIYILDGQSLASIQAYEAYAVALGTFDDGYKNFAAGKSAAQVVGAAAQTIAGVLATLRSTADYTVEAVDYKTDPLVAQVAHYLPTTAYVPRMQLSQVDDLVLKFNDAVPADDEACSQLKKTVPEQLGCVLQRRSAAYATVPDVSSKNGALVYLSSLDSLFVSFLGSVLGTPASVSSSKQSQADGHKQDANQGGGKDGAGDGNDGQGDGGGGQTPPTNRNASGSATPELFSLAGLGGTIGQTSGPLALAQIVQGRRLKKLWSEDPSSRVLVLESTAAGGASRTIHNFFLEVFGTTPTPSFTGGAIATFFLINPATGAMEKSGVFRNTTDYGKFHGKKVQSPNNFCSDPNQHWDYQSHTCK